MQCPLQKQRSFKKIAKLGRSGSSGQIPNLFVCLEALSLYTGVGWKWGGWECVRSSEVMLEGDWLKVRRRGAVCGLMKLLLPLHLSSAALSHTFVPTGRRRCLHTNFLSGHLVQWNIPSKCQIYNQRMGPTQLHTAHHHQFEQCRCRGGGGGGVQVPSLLPPSLNKTIKDWGVAPQNWCKTWSIGTNSKIWKLERFEHWKNKEQRKWLDQIVGEDGRTCTIFNVGLRAFGAQAVRFQHIFLPILSILDILYYTSPFCALLDQLTISGPSKTAGLSWIQQG